MQEIIGQAVEAIQEIVANTNIGISLFVGIFIIVLESILPILPLAVFVSINMIAFGNIIGFILSWLATTLGCSLSFYICRRLRKTMTRKLKTKEKILNFINKVNEISFSSLVLILAMPFTPAFSVNIAAGLSKMEYKKYLLALLMGKMFMVYFWGFIGTTFVESITDIRILIKIIIIIGLAFLLSKIMTKKFNL